MNINLVAKLLSEGESAESARAIAEQYERLSEGGNNRKPDDFYEKIIKSIFDNFRSITKEDNAAENNNEYTDVGKVMGNISDSIEKLKKLESEFYKTSKQSNETFDTICSVTSYEIKKNMKIKY